MIRATYKVSPSDSSAASLDPEFARAEPLVRSARTRLLPTGCSDWLDGLKPPEHKLDVDKQLAEVAAGRRKILSASEVRERYSITSIKGWPSHQIALRFQLVWYAEVEFQDSITSAANETRVARRRLHLIGAAEKSLDKYLRLSRTDAEIRTALVRVRTVKDRVSSELHASCPAQGGKPAQNWKAWFVFRLAAFWYVITGEQPPSSPESHFAQLVSAAWNSLHPNIPEIKLDTFVRRFARSASLEDAREAAFIPGLYVRSSISRPLSFCQKPTSSRLEV